jgi:uncharacterized protein
MSGGHPIDHRLWRPPATPWIGHMTWRDLLFAHWAVPSEALRPHVPPQFEIDEFDGTAYLAVVPFLMTGIRPRWLPPIPGFSRMLELNVRTYVTHRGDPGVWFFSLDCESKLAVRVARATYHLNYLDARMSLEHAAADWIQYTSTRTHPGAPPAELRARYRPSGEPYLSDIGSLEHWLTERYALFATDSASRLYRGDIHHAQWPLQPAEAEFEHCTMTHPLGLTMPGAPLLHFSRSLEVIVWPARVVH